MEIESTTFGAITIDGKTYVHDVIIRLSGGEAEEEAVKEALRHLAHGLEEEAKFVFEKGFEQIILGSGQVGNVQLSLEAAAYFAKKGCKVLLQPTPEAIRVFSCKEDRAFSRDLLKRTGADRQPGCMRSSTTAMPHGSPGRP